MSQIQQCVFEGVRFMAEKCGLEEAIKASTDVGASRKEAIGAIFTVGGVYAVNLTEEALSIMGAAGADTSMYQPGPMVVSISEFTEGLTEEEAKAVVAHEVGHLKHDHLELEMTEVNGVRISLHEHAELQADAYAVSLGLGEALISGIEKLVGNVAYYFGIYTANKHLGDLYRQETLASVQYRFAAIRAAIAN